MEIKELRNKDKNELERMAKDLKKKLNDIRFKRSANQLKDVHELSSAKKEIARILTIMKELDSK